MKIAAVVLAAGMSRRMGRDKLSLPWGQHTVIEQVISILGKAGVLPIRLVCGATQAHLKQLLTGHDLEFVYNPDFADGEMIRSLQVGLDDLPANLEGTLVVLGDQPHIELEIVDMVLDTAVGRPQQLVIPSYQMRRGHPWYLPRRYWPLVQQLQPPETLRDFLNRHRDDVYYINVNRASILLDLDTPEDYLHHKPE